MKCDIDICNRKAKFNVWFTHHERPIAYCLFHALDMRGNWRWKEVHIRRTERIT